MTTFIRNCVFAFKCEKKWEQLTQTKNTDVRFCDACQREVFFCKADDQLRESIVLNRCVAVEFENTTTKNITRLMGVVRRKTDLEDDDIPY